MSRIVRRRSVLEAALVFTVSWTPSAARACEFFLPHLRVFHPWTRATAEGAAAAVVCMRFDEVTMTDRLVGVESPLAAAAEMGGPQAGAKVGFAIPAGQVSALSETGAHVRLVGLHQRIEPARSYPLTLRFESGGIVVATLNVDYARFQ